MFDDFLSEIVRMAGISSDKKIFGDYVFFLDVESNIRLGTKTYLASNSIDYDTEFITVYLLLLGTDTESESSDEEAPEPIILRDVYQYDMDKNQASDLLMKALTKKVEQGIL